MSGYSIDGDKASEVPVSAQERGNDLSDLADQIGTAGVAVVDESGIVESDARKNTAEAPGEQLGGKDGADDRRGVLAVVDDEAPATTKRGLAEEHSPWPLASSSSALPAWNTGGEELDDAERDICLPWLGPFDAKLEAITNGAPEYRLMACVQDMLKKVKINFVLSDDITGPNGALDVTQLVIPELRLPPNYPSFARRQDTFGLQVIAMDNAWINMMSSMTSKSEKVLMSHHGVGINRQYLVQHKDLTSETTEENPSKFASPVSLMVVKGFMIWIRVAEHGWTSTGLPPKKFLLPGEKIVEKPMSYGNSAIILEVRIDILLESKWQSVRMNWFHFLQEHETVAMFKDAGEDEETYKGMFSKRAIYVPDLDKLKDRVTEFARRMAEDATEISVRIENFVHPEKAPCNPTPMNERHYSGIVDLNILTIRDPLVVLNPMVRIMNVLTLMQQNMCGFWAFDRIYNVHTFKEQAYKDQFFYGEFFEYFSTQKAPALALHRKATKDVPEVLEHEREVLEATSVKPHDFNFDFEAALKITGLKKEEIKPGQIPKFTKYVTATSIKGQLSRFLHDVQKSKVTTSDWKQSLRVRTLLLMGCAVSSKIPLSGLAEQNIGSKLRGLIIAFQAHGIDLEKTNQKLVAAIAQLPGGGQAKKHKRPRQEDDEESGNESDSKRDREDDPEHAEGGEMVRGGQNKGKYKKGQDFQGLQLNGAEIAATTAEHVKQIVTDEIANMMEAGIFKEVLVLQNQTTVVLQDIQHRLTSMQDKLTELEQRQGNLEQESKLLEHQVLTKGVLMDCIKDEAAMRSFWFRMKAHGVQQERIVELLKSCYMLPPQTLAQFLDEQHA